MWRTARSDHTIGGEWRCLFATHANPIDSAEAINRLSVRHLHYIYRRPSQAQHLGLARTLKPVSLLGHNLNTARITTHQCPRIQPRRFLPLSGLWQAMPNTKQTMKLVREPVHHTSIPFATRYMFSSSRRVCHPCASLTSFSFQ